MNEHLFRGQYRIDATRLLNYDYGSNGAYFVTVCTKDKLHYFGEIITTTEGPIIKPTVIGQRVIDGWFSIPEFSAFVQLGEFQLMPNHLHGIIFFDKPNYSDWQPNTFGPQSQNLGSVLRGYKAGVKAFATTNNIDFVWQTRYHDRVIRSNDELNRIRQYIVENPANWERDRDNDQGLYM